VPPPLWEAPPPLLPMLPTLELPEAALKPPEAALKPLLRVAPTDAEVVECGAGREALPKLELVKPPPVAGAERVVRFSTGAGRLNTGPDLPLNDDAIGAGCRPISGALSKVSVARPVLGVIGSAGSGAPVSLA